jgi:hypothetical protein
MQPFTVYLQNVSPETLALLRHPSVSFQYRENYQYRVGQRHLFNQLSNSPHIDRLREAARHNQLEVRISFVDPPAGIEYVTRIAHTRGGVKVFRSSKPYLPHPDANFR